MFIEIHELELHPIDFEEEIRPGVLDLGEDLRQVEALRTAGRELMRKEKIEQFRDRFANPYVAAERGYVDAVIQPRDTRKKLIHALEMLGTKRDKNPPKKHGNIPL